MVFRHSRKNFINFFLNRYSLPPVTKPVIPPVGIKSKPETTANLTVGIKGKPEEYGTVGGGDSITKLTVGIKGETRGDGAEQNRGEKNGWEIQNNQISGWDKRRAVGGRENGKERRIGRGSREAVRREKQYNPSNGWDKK